MRKLLFAALSSIVAICFAIGVAPLPIQAQDADGGFTIGEGKLAFTAPEGWKKKQPATRIVEAEYEIPAAKGDERPGRLTAMGAGGTVEANVERWVGQFVDSPKPKLDKLTVNNIEVQLVDLAGTYKDGAPFSGRPPELREDYRMLGAVIVTPDAGNYFLKLYGPKATVGANEKAFQELVKSLKVK